MNVNFGQTVNGLSGQPLLDGEKKPVTLGKLCIDALLANFPDEGMAPGTRAISGEEKVKRYNLATKVHTSTEANQAVLVSIEEVAQVKTLVGKMYGPNVVGPAWQLLELAGGEPAKK